jgi:hypothetical protein
MPSGREVKFETKMSNPKLETLNSLPTGRQVSKLKCPKDKTQNRSPGGENYLLSFIFWVCLGFGV